MDRNTISLDVNRKFLQVISSFLIAAIIAIFFVFLGTDSLIETAKGKYFLADLCMAFLTAFALLLYLGLLTRYVYHKKTGSGKWLKLGYQFAGGVLIPAVLIFVVFNIYLVQILGFSMKDVTFLVYEFPIAVILLLVLNAIFIGYHYFIAYERSAHRVQLLEDELISLKLAESNMTVQSVGSEQSTEEGSEIPAADNTQRSISTLIVTSGSKNIPIQVENIAYIYKDGNVTALQLFDGQRYLMNYTLDEMASLLDGRIFFRVNRQFIIHKKSCHYFTNEDHGRLAITLRPDFDSEIIVSQKKAAPFKSWING